MSFEQSFEYLLKWEGGYGNDPRDPGGATNLGVIQTEYDAYRQEKGRSPQSVAHITRAEAEDIYKAKYWNVARCDALNPGVANATFDACVNSGNAHGVRWLQQAINQVAGHDMVPVDDVSGSKTLTAAAVLPPDKLIDAILALRLAFMHVAKNPKTGAALWPVFGKGWSARINGVRSQSHAMAGLPAPVNPLSQPQPQPTSQPDAATMLWQMLFLQIVPTIMNKVISMATTANPAPVPAPSPNTSTGVTVNSTQNLATHIITAVGAVLAATGLSQIHSMYDVVTNSSLIGGLIVSGLAMLISHFNVNGSNSNTIDMIDKVIVALTPHSATPATPFTAATLAPEAGAQPA